MRSRALTGMQPLEVDGAYGEGGGQLLRTTRVLTAHAHTAMWLIEQFLPIRFMVRETGGLVHVAVVPTAR